MTTVDVSKLSYAQLLELSRELEHKITEKRDEELKVLVDGIAKKLEAAGFSVDEALVALQPYASGAKRKTTQAGATAPVLYRDPSNPGNTWSGRGRAARWLSDYEAAGRKREEFKV
ncbi:H-NS family nucleoid-associated regulatory protein [Roseateles chitinivorans]|uniref:H-NS histone family protein n=1 Tax=Roseateles chitinivorans TaxID=2917965 RepID=UPI003D664810